MVPVVLFKSKMEIHSQEKPQEALLEVSNIDTFHGNIQALWGVSLMVKHGEIVAIVGTNGAGKSTLLDTISGVYHPRSGSITFEGKSIKNLTPFQIVSLGICQVPEGRRLFPDMTVEENLIIGSYNQTARSKKQQNIKDICELFPILGEREKQLAKTLSGGEQQMLAIGRGLMSNPKLMLIDEMSLGLASIVTNEIWKSLHKIRGRGVTVVLVEQNVKRSLEEVDRAYILEQGCIVLSGAAAELHENERVKQAYFGV